MQTIEQVKLYDRGHWEHTAFDPHFVELGRTTYNEDMGSNALRKTGKAPHSLLALFPYWENKEAAESDLWLLGFRPINDVTFVREIYDVQYKR